MAEYRIVTDAYAGYEVQRRWRWFPFWIQVGTNTHSTIEKAEAFAKERANVRSVVRQLGNLP